MGRFHESLQVRHRGVSAAGLDDCGKFRIARGSDHEGEFTAATAENGIFSGRIPSSSVMTLSRINTAWRMGRPVGVRIASKARYWAGVMARSSSKLSKSTP